MLSSVLGKCRSILLSYLFVCYKIKLVNLTNETLTTQQQKYTASWYTPKDPRCDMTKMLKQITMKKKQGWKNPGCLVAMEAEKINWCPFSRLPNLCPANKYVSGT